MKSHLSLGNYFAVLLCFGMLGTVWSSSVFADCELAKLLASDGASGDRFGISVGISGDTAVIGAWWDDDSGNRCGSAYIFRFNGSNWVEEAKLLASDGAEYDYFGYSVGISGDTAIIGAYSDDDNGDGSGSAYIFRFDDPNWVEEAKLLASDGESGDEFGWSVGISGDTVVIGARHDDDNGLNSGSAYIFRFDGSSWVEEPKLLASDGESGNDFGWSVGISGDAAVIGTRTGEPNGSAYIFRFNGSNWVEEAKLFGSNDTPSTTDHFGESVGISGDTVIIGAYGIGYSAHIFRFDDPNWVEEAQLQAGTAWDNFGYSVGISGDAAVVGAPRNDTYTGLAYIFRFNGSSWVEEAKLLASDRAVDDYFGYSVGISGDNAIIGAYGDDDNGLNSGSAYIFCLSLNLGDLDCDNDVDFVDYSLFALYWLETDCGYCGCDGADFTGDGGVDYYDLKELCDNWLAGK